MAGQPKRRAMIDELERRRTDYFEGDPVPTVLDYVACWLEDGRPLNDMTAEMSKQLGVDVHRGWISSYLRKQFGEEAVDERLGRSRVRASHLIAEDVIRVSDEAAATSVDVARNGVRSRARMWTAEKWNPQQYGQAKQTNVSISLTSLHLTALQHQSPIVTGGTNSLELPSRDAVALPAQVQVDQRVSSE